MPTQCTCKGTYRYRFYIPFDVRAPPSSCSRRTSHVLHRHNIEGIRVKNVDILNFYKKFENQQCGKTIVSP